MCHGGGGVDTRRQQGSRPPPRWRSMRLLSPQNHAAVCMGASERAVDVPLLTDVVPHHDVFARYVQRQSPAYLVRWHVEGIGNMAFEMVQRWQHQSPQDRSCRSLCATSTFLARATDAMNPRHFPYARAAAGGRTHTLRGSRGQWCCHGDGLCAHLPQHDVEVTLADGKAKGYYHAAISQMIEGTMLRDELALGA